MILSWGHTVYGQFQLLAGKSAPHDFIQLIIYKAVTFSDEIEKIDTVRAYHVRPRPLLPPHPSRTFPPAPRSRNAVRQAHASSHRAALCASSPSFHCAFT